MYPHHVFDLEPAGTFGMYPICYWWVSGGYLQPEPAMYSRCFHWFPGPLAPSGFKLKLKDQGFSDPNLRNGHAYMVNDISYKKHLKDGRESIEPVSS